jgi:hypothetical protein
MTRVIIYGYKLRTRDCNEMNKEKDCNKWGICKMFWEDRTGEFPKG